MAIVDRPRSNRLWLRTASALGVTLAVVTGLLTHDGNTGDRANDGLRLSASVVTPPTGQEVGSGTTTGLPTEFRAASFNVLGHSHTARGASRTVKLDGRSRQKRVNAVIRTEGLSIIGFQEFEQPQIDTFEAEFGDEYSLFPGRSYKGSFSVNVRGNSIAWRTSEWQLVESSYYDAPYYKGYNVPRPLVLLQNVVSGQQVYVANTHNAANNFPGAQKQRDIAVAIQTKLLSDLRRKNPDIPIIFVGDMNDKQKFFCDLVANSPLRPVNGGTKVGNKCTLPPQAWIDWMTSTTDIKWSNYRALRTPTIRAISDHPLLIADATIQPPAARKAGIKRAVVVDIQGLPSAALVGSGSTPTPNLDRLMATGASTLNARTAAEVAGSLPNLISTLSAKPVTAAGGAHQFIFSKDKPKKKSFATVAKKTGIYIPTLFDRVHDNGGSTSFMSSDKHSAIVMRSARNGARDTQGIDYGTKKVSVASIRKSDASALKVLKDQIRLNPRTISVVQFSGPRIAGEKYGYFSPKYKAAVRKVDSQIGSLWSSIRANKNTASSTALVITSTNGGQQKSSKGSALTQSQIPLIVAAPGVKGGSNLYALNPTFKDPGNARPSYAGAQPLRNLNVGNLVTGVLGYPELWTASAATKAINIFPPADPAQRR